MDLQHQAEDARFVAYRQQGNALRDIHLRLNQLLRSRIHVGRVRNLNIAGDVLLNGDPGTRTAYGADVGRIDLDTASAEELLHPAADGSIESAAQERIGG